MHKKEEKVMELEQLIGNKRKIAMNIYRSQQYYISEAYNALCANLQFCGEDIKSVALVSCESGKDTASVVWNLALSLAEAEKNILVINANMHKSGITDKYQLEATEKGLSEYLSGSCQMEDCIFQTSYKHLFILSSGAVSEKSSKLLNSHRFCSLMMEVRKVFDYILVDCPPLSNTIDGAVAAKICDASVIVLESDKTKRQLVKSVKMQLDKAGCRILGVILNRFNARRFKCYGNYFGKS